MIVIMFLVLFLNRRVVASVFNVLTCYLYIYLSDALFSTLSIVFYGMQLEFQLGG